MTLERSVRLDLSLPGSSPGAGQGLGQGLSSGAGRHQEPPDAQSRERFERALAGAAGPAAPEPQTGAASTLPPMALFPPVSIPGGPGLAPRSTRPLAALVAESVSRLMVGEGAGGGKQVRMTLEDDLLPGVTVTVQTLEGRLQVDFTCEIEPSRVRLVEAVPRMAQELASRLAREVLVRVQSAQGDDPPWVEALAQAPGPGSVNPPAGELPHG